MHAYEEIKPVVCTCPGRAVRFPQGASKGQIASWVALAASPAAEDRRHAAHHLCQIPALPRGREIMIELFMDTDTGVQQLALHWLRGAAGCHPYLLNGVPLPDEFLDALVRSKFPAAGYLAARLLPEGSPLWLRLFHGLASVAKNALPYISNRSPLAGDVREVCKRRWGWDVIPEPETYVLMATHAVWD